MAETKQKAGAKVTEVEDHGIATFGEPVAQVRSGRASWQDEASAVEPIDRLIDAYSDAYGGNGDGYNRSVSNFTYAPFAGDTDSKTPVAVRIASRVNQRAEARQVPVHARSIRGVLHLVTGVRVVKPRKKRNGNGNGDGSHSD